MKKIPWNEVLGKVSFFLSLISLTISCCIAYSCNIGKDGASEVLAAFSIIVTLLIGWNIYSALDIQSNIKRTETKYVELLSTHKEMEKRLITNDNIIGALTLARVAQVEASVKKGSEISLDFNLIYDTLKAVKLLEKYHQYSEANGCIWVLINSSYPKNFKLSQEQLGFLMKEFDEIKSTLTNHPQLKDFMNNLNADANLQQPSN